MKIRNGFISNSSSSSFILDIGKISGLQLQQILNLANTEDQFREDPWYFELDGINLKGTTSLDNFSMRDFFEAINIQEGAYTFGSY